MAERPVIDPTTAPRVPPGVSLLIVATVAVTLRGFLAPYARHFRSLGWRVDAAGNGATTDPGVLDAYDHVYELPLSRSILDLGGIVRSERTIARILGTKPDLVHVHTPIASLVTRFAVRRTPRERRPALAYTAHGFHFHQDGSPLTNAVFLTVERVAGRWTDRLVVINDEDEAAAIRHHIVPDQRLVRMPGIGLDTAYYSRSAIDPDAPGRARAELVLGPDQPLLVVVAELTPNKRHADVIAALTAMRRTDVTLAILGTGPELERLEELAGERGVRDRVRFAGFVGDIRPVVASATGLVLASEREGLARSVMEALALETPVIASTARGNRELIGDDRGLLVPVGDVTALAAAMDWLVDQPDEGRAMGRLGRARMIERYDLQAVIALHEAMYGAMLNLPAIGSRD